MGRSAYCIVDCCNLLSRRSRVASPSEPLRAKRRTLGWRVSVLDFAVIELVRPLDGIRKEITQVRLVEESAFVAYGFGVDPYRRACRRRSYAV